MPYAAFSLAGFVIYDGIIAHSWQGLDHYGREVLGVLYGTPGGPYELMVFPLWFLLSLFLAQVMFSGVLLASRDRPVRGAAFISALAVLGFLNGRTLHLAAPWSAASALVGTGFLALGYACRRHMSRISAISAGRKLLGVALLGTIVLATALRNEPVIMAHGSYGTIPLFLLGACCGIGMIVLLSMLVKQLHQAVPQCMAGVAFTVPVYLGRNTLTILAMHVPVAALAAHWLAHSSSPMNPAFNAIAVKLLALLLLLASIELFKRCSLVTPRSSSPKPSPLPLPPVNVRS